MPPIQRVDNIVHPHSLPLDQGGEMLCFSRKEAGWEWMSLGVRRILPGQTIEMSTSGEEMALVLLGGDCCLDWGQGERTIRGRKNVFDGLPHALYLPEGQRVAFKAITVCEIAECRVPSTAKFEPKLITPADVSTGLRGGENASRQIVDIITPSFLADKLVVIEVYTPGGNWSSYPPHKHDVHDPPREVDLDEIYYYRFKDPKGYALQNLYTPASGREAILKVHDGDAVLVRDGYHPVVAGPGYDTYYLNFLAGSSRTLAVTEDPDHVWLRSTWKLADARLPLVS